MWNTRKTIGVITGGAGVFFARIDVFLSLEKTLLFSLNALGMVLALAGIAIYATGMPSALKRFKACPACFTKNDAAAVACKKCKKIFPEATSE